MSISNRLRLQEKKEYHEKKRTAKLLRKLIIGAVLAVIIMLGSMNLIPGFSGLSALGQEHHNIYPYLSGTVLDRSTVLPGTGIGIQIQGSRYEYPYCSRYIISLHI